MLYNLHHIFSRFSKFNSKVYRFCLHFKILNLWYNWMYSHVKLLQLRDRKNKKKREEAGTGRTMFATNVSCRTDAQQALQYTDSHNITLVKVQTQLVSIPRKIMKASYPAYHCEMKEQVLQIYVFVYYYCGLCLSNFWARHRLEFSFIAICLSFSHMGAIIELRHKVGAISDFVVWTFCIFRVLLHDLLDFSKYICLAIYTNYM
jgi:hypothetical protein